MLNIFLGGSSIERCKFDEKREKRENNLGFKKIIGLNIQKKYLFHFQFDYDFAKNFKFNEFYSWTENFQFFGEIYEKNRDQRFYKCDSDKDDIERENSYK